MQGCIGPHFMEERAVGLRINTNVAALSSARTLRRSTNDLNVSLERLSTGLRINRAADDAAGLAISESFRTVIRGSLVAQRNSQDGISLVQTAEGALSETTNILQRMRELALQAANGTQSDQNRAVLQLEIEQLLDQIDDIANNTEFNNVRVLSGEPQSEPEDPAEPRVAKEFSLQNGIRKGQRLLISMDGARAADLGIGDAGWEVEVDGDGNIVLDENGVPVLDPGSGVTQFKIDVSTLDGAVAALERIDGALSRVITLRSDLGAYQNRLEFTMQTLAIQEENSTASDSALRDADIARETIQFTRNQILVTAGTSVLAQSNVIPQTALQLLGG